MMMQMKRAEITVTGNCHAAFISLVLCCFSASAAEIAPQALGLRGYSASISNVAVAPQMAGSARVTGSWVNSTTGPAIFRRGMIHQAAQIAPIGSVVKPASLVRRVNWRYSFLTSAPHGLQAYLCNYLRCFALSGATGTTTAFNGDSAYSNFSFAFVMNGNGALSPALQGQLNYVAVNYE